MGFVSNGEFNYLRSKGYSRPLSVLQIGTAVRNKYSRISQTVLLDMLSPKGVFKFTCIVEAVTLVFF